MVGELMLPALIGDLAAQWPALATQVTTAWGGLLVERIARRELDAALAQRAQELLAELGATNVSLVRGPLTAGYPQKAPYDVILLDGAVHEIPDSIAGQLSLGGRLVAVLQADGPGRAILATRTEAGLSQRVVFDCSVPSLPGFAKTPSFVF